MENKYDSIILAMILASILSLVASVFYINFFFTKELLLLAIMIIFAIGVFYSLATKKDSAHSWIMLFFVVGIANGFFMYFMTNALMTYLLIATNILGFVTVLQTVPGKKSNKGPKIIIKEVKESEEVPQRTQKESHDKIKAKTAHHKNKPKKMTEEELVKTEEEILKELDKAIAEKQSKLSKAPARASAGKNRTNKTSEYYDDDSEEDNNVGKVKTVVPTREVDDFVNALSSFESQIKKAKRPAKKAANKGKAKKRR